MFGQFTKGLGWPLGPLSLLLFLLIIISRINTSVLAKSSSSEVNAVTASDDYGSEDDETSAPAEQNQPKGPKPYFEKPMQTIYLGSANKAHINCSPKNFNDGHSILWYKSNQLIVNGNHSMSNGYQVDGKMNLIIDQITKDTPDKYVCQIVPGNVNQTTILKAGEDPEGKSAGGQMNFHEAIFIAISLIYLAKLLMNDF